MSYRYFLNLSYNGKAYHGWQIQANALSVQEVLNNKLSTILREPIQLTGAGRTDTGVHARSYTAHFDLSYEIRDFGYFLNGLNKLLPHDIAVQGIYRAIPDANARFSALSRTYEYRITTRKDPFLQDFAWYFKVPLDLSKMNQAAQILFEYDDFTSFSKLGTQVATNLCKIYYAKWFEESDLLIFRIRADRFLRNMVRAIVGTLIDVGLGKTTCEDFREIIKKKDRCRAGFSVPAHGLFLVDIAYPPSIQFDSE
jgi:tRNA pseudouridine38-40 synthase